MKLEINFIEINDMSFFFYTFKINLKYYSMSKYDQHTPDQYLSINISSCFLLFILLLINVINIFSVANYMGGGYFA